MKRSRTSRTSKAALLIRKPALPNSRNQPEAEKLAPLVGELSAAMAQVPAEAVDGEIEKWLGKISLALDLDRSAIYERDAPNRLVRTSHTWLRPNFPPFPKKYDPQKMFEKTTNWVLAGNQLVFSSPEKIPSSLRDVKVWVLKHGPKASAALPMWAGGRVIGAVSFGRFRSARTWSAELLDHLALIVRIFGAAIERKQAEAAARLARNELALAQRRSMMGELVASLTHELNQPLGAVLSNLGGLARLLAQGNPDSALASRAVNNAIEDAKRAGEIVRRVRAMFRGDVTKKTSIAMAELVNEVAALVASEASLRQISVQIQASSALPAVLGDRILLQQCLLNLLMNAFEALASVDRAQRKVTVQIALRRLESIEIRINDTGPGIHPSIAARLFEPFVTTKSNGMGLGLLVTRSIIEEHGGKIVPEPGAERGTTFTLTLPVATREKKRSPGRPARKKPAKERVHAR